MRFRCPIPVLMLMLTMAGLCVARPQTPDDAKIQHALQAAQTAYNQKDFPRSEQILNRILSENPHDYAANEIMALALTAQHHDAAASAFFQAAVTAAPSSAVAHSNFAANLARLHRGTQAEGEFHAALKINPRSYDLNHNLGEFYAATGKIALAVPFLREAQRLNPRSYPNGYDLALAELRAGMLQESARDIHTLLAVDDAAALHSLLGGVYEKQGKYVAAEQELQQAARMDPSEENLFRWGAELLRHRATSPAIEVFELGVSRYPQSWKLQVGLAVAWRVNGKQIRSADALLRAIQIDPETPQPYFFLAESRHVSAKTRARICDSFRQYAKLQPANPRAHLYYALSLWRLDPEETNPATLPAVEQQLHKALSLDPKLAEAHLQLGEVYSAENNINAAIAQYGKAVALDSTLDAARYRLGLALVRNGDKARGKKELTKWSQLHTVQNKRVEQESRQLIKFIYTRPMN